MSDQQLAPSQGTATSASGAPDLDANVPTSKDKIKDDLRGRPFAEQEQMLYPQPDDAKQVEALLTKEQDELREKIGKVKGDGASIDLKIAEAEVAKKAAPAGDAASAAAQDEALEKLRSQKSELAAQEDELEDELIANQSDIDTVATPGTPKDKLDAIAAKHNSTAKSGAASESTVAADGTRTVTTSSLGNGVATSTETTDHGNKKITEEKGTVGNLVDAGKALKNGKDWGQTETTTAVSGDSEGSNTVTDKSNVSLTGGYSNTKGTSSTFKDGEHETSESDMTETQVGLGGASRTNTKSQKVGDHEISDTTESKITREDGKLGASRSSTHKDGTVDDDGNLTEGTETKKSANGEVTMNGNEVGLGGGAGVDRKSVSKSGVKTGVSAHCGGNVSVQVVPSEDGTGYDLVIGVKLEGSLGGTAGKGDSEKGGGASATVKASGSYTKTFTRHLSPDEVAPYLAQLDSIQPGGGGSGKFQEFGVIATAWKAGWNGASVEGALAQVSDDPEKLKALQKGESNETVVTAGVEGEVEGGAKNDTMGGSIKVGGSADTTIKNKFTDTGDGTDMNAEVDNSLGWKAGADGTFEGVNAGGSYGTKDITGMGVTLSVPKDDPRYAEIVARVKAAKTQADIEKLKADYPGIKIGTSKLEGSETSLEGHMGVAGVSVSLGNEYGNTHKEEVDADGNRTDTYEGHQKANGSIGTESIRLGSSRSDSATMTVTEGKDKDGKPTQEMEADFSVVTTESNIDKSLMAATDKKDKSVAQQALGGGEKPKVEEDTDEQGMFADNRSMDQLIGEASNPSAWQKHCVTGDRDDWIALGKAIRNAKGDKKAISKAISEFVGDEGSGRDEFLMNTIRPPGTNEYGSAYEFPGTLSAEKATYKRLVDGDPTKSIKAAMEKDKAEGVEQAKSVLSELDGLEARLASKQNEFQDVSRFGEMMRRLANRKQEVMALTGASDFKTDQARYNQLLTNCMRFKALEDEQYAQAQGNFDGERETDPIKNVAIQNKLAALYKDWDPEYKEMCGLGFEWNFDKSIYAKYAPAHDRWDKLYKGKPPEEKSLEQTNHEAAAEREADEQSERMWQNSSFHAEAQAQAAAQSAQTEKQKVIPIAKGRVNAAKMACANAAGWHNYAMSKGQPVSPEAQSLAGKGWTQWSLVNDDYTFENAVKQDVADASAVNRLADKKCAAYKEAQTLFEQGKAANHT